MKNLVRHIEYLLQSHDCVVIPGLGAILCHGEAARCTPAGVWQAPRRVMSFNPCLDRTDGLLAQSVARREGISLPAAAIKVNSAAAEMRRTLGETGTLDLGFAGSLHTDAAGLMSYEPSAAPWLSPATLWLPEIEATPVVGASQLAHSVEKEISRRGRFGTIMRRSATIAASVTAVLLLGWTIKTTLPQAPAGQMASVAPSTPRGIVQNPGDDRSTLVLVISRSDDSSVPVDEPDDAEPAADIEAPAVNQAPDPVVNTEATEQAPARLNDSDSYFLIVASLNSLEEAQRYVAKNSPLNLGILTVGNRFRVYAATGNSAAAAAAGKNGDIAARFPDAWVCRR